MRLKPTNAGFDRLVHRGRCCCTQANENLHKPSASSHLDLTSGYVYGRMSDACLAVEAHNLICQRCGTLPDNVLVMI